ISSGDLAYAPAISGRSVVWAQGNAIWVKDLTTGSTISHPIPGRDHILSGVGSGGSLFSHWAKDTCIGMGKAIHA
ncbi:MAG: hypothetical protein NTY03_00985, partial [Candidatus Bathyarchaeota archaeon]|nr:hypothetical protein [Candidatus Bathyarchaeota archaeon]